MTDPISRDLGFMQNAISLRQQRQEVLATNIANADTPNYKARDFDFSAALKEAVAGRSSGNLALATTAAAHLPGSTQESSARLLYRNPVQPSADGNTVDMDVERAQFSENAVQYEASVAFITAQIKLLTAAVQA